MGKHVYSKLLCGTLCVLLTGFPIGGTERTVTHDGGPRQEIDKLRNELSQKDIVIRRLNQTIKSLQDQVRGLQQDLQRAKEEKARLEGQLTAMKTVKPADANLPPKSQPKREVSLAALLKMNSAQIRTSVGCRFTGRMPVLSVEAIANAPGQYRVTAVTPMADAQAATQPAPNQRLTKCIFQISIPVGVTVGPQKGATMVIGGDIKQVVALPAGDEDPKEVQVYLANFQPTP